MTKAYSFRAALIALMLVAVSLAVVTLQYVTGFFTKGLADSATMRVSTSNVCSTDDGAHFTGCSSIL